MAKAYPSDLRVDGTSGSLLPGARSYVLQISSDREGVFAVYQTDRAGAVIEEDTFTVSDTQLEELWSAIQKNDFFSLESRYTREDIEDGAYASLTVTASGRTHQVEVENTNVPRFRGVLEAVNRITPTGNDLPYEISAANP